MAPSSARPEAVDDVIIASANVIAADSIARLMGPEPPVSVENLSDTEDRKAVQSSKQAPQSKKKKNRNTNKSQLRKGGPTGFEEYFVDAPITPEEHAVDVELYSTTNDFQERIEVAISRFYARRKFGSWQKELFDKYLTFGGFDTGPRAFGSFDPKDEALADMNAAEIARMKVSVSMSRWVLEGSGEVDFDGVLKAFLSNNITRFFSPVSGQEIKDAVNIIRNFLNYLLHHNVCPEYEDQVQAARRTCDRADIELCLCHESARLMPGDLNTACSQLFGGYFSVDNDGWATVVGSEKCDKYYNFGLSQDRVGRVFQGAMASHSTPKMFASYQEQAAAGQIRHTNSFSTGLEVTEIEYSSNEVKTFYSHSSMYGIKPTGKLKCKSWFNENGLRENLTEEEEAEIAANGRPVFHYEFIVEDELLEKMFAGMLLQVDVHETSFGLYYFDTVVAVMVSFYTHILNIDMEGYKESVELEPREPYGKPQLKAFIPESASGTGEGHGVAQVSDAAAKQDIDSDTEA